VISVLDIYVLNPAFFWRYIIIHQGTKITYIHTYVHTQFYYTKYLTSKLLFN